MASACVVGSEFALLPGLSHHHSQTENQRDHIKTARSVDFLETVLVMSLIGESCPDANAALLAHFSYQAITVVCEVHVRHENSASASAGCREARRGLLVRLK